METNTNNLRWLALSTRLYQALLAIYPSEFRQAYGNPMQQLFRDCCRQALRESGAAGLLSLWMRTMLDTVQTALEEHTQRGIEMSKDKFIKLSGWAMIIGGLVTMLGWLASTRPEYEPYNFLRNPIDFYANAVEIPLIVTGLILLSVGFSGLYLRYGRVSNGFGRFCLGFGAASGVVSAIGAAGMNFNEAFWSLFFFGLTFQFLGLALFGITNLRQRTLPRWNGLPLLAGAWVPLFVLVSLIVEQVSGRWVETPGAVFPIVWLLTLVGLAGLGYLLQSDPQPASTAAAPA
jgi:hypothetical protein